MPKEAIFPLNIETGFIVNAPVTSNTAALSIYSLCCTHRKELQIAKVQEKYHKTYIKLNPECNI